MSVPYFEKVASSIVVDLEAKRPESGKIPAEVESAVDLH